ncbi:MAG: glycosyltransferase family 4 protein [Candidatus Micrarchaeota archaeon]
MNIVHVNPFYPPSYWGGIEKYVKFLSEYLVERGHNVSVICANMGGEKSREKINGVRVYRMKSIVFKKLPSLLPPPWSFEIGFWLNGYKLLKKLNPDVIHIHNRYFPGLYPVIFYKKMLKKPMIITIHNSKPEKNNEINRQTNALAGAYDMMLGNMLMRSCDFIAGNSQYSADATVPPGYGPENVGVAYNGIHTSEWKKVKSDFKKGHCRKGEQMILADARLVPQKGMDYLIRALPELDFKYKLVVKGNGPELKKLQKLANHLGVWSKVEFVTRRDFTENQMIHLYSAADMFVLPSLHEPFGIVLLQAMATETPIVTTDVGGVNEVVGDTALKVKSRSSSALAKAMNRLAKDEKLKKELTKKARARVVKMFDWSAAGRQMEDIYKKVVKKHKK